MEDKPQVGRNCGHLDDEDNACELGMRVPVDCSRNGKTVTCTRYQDVNASDFPPITDAHELHHDMAYGYRHAGDWLAEEAERFHRGVEEKIMALFLNSEEENHLLSLAAKSRYAMLEVVSRVHYVASRLE